MLLNNLEDEHSLLMTFAQIMSNSKKKIFHLKILQKLRPEN